MTSATTDPARSALAAITGTGWVAGGLDTSGGMAALNAGMRPIDQLSAAGLGWLVGQVQPLQNAVQRMRGNASVIQAFAGAWQQAAKNLDQTATALTRAVATNTAGWHGAAADAYRSRADGTVAAIRGQAALAAGLAAATQTMAQALAGARQSAGDQLTNLIRQLIPLALMAIAAGGGLSPNVLAQATKMINASGGQIATIERGVRQTITNVAPLLRALATGTNRTPR